MMASSKWCWHLHFDYRSNIKSFIRIQKYIVPSFKWFRWSEQILLQFYWRKSKSIPFLWKVKKILSDIGLALTRATFFILILLAAFKGKCLNIDTNEVFGTWNLVLSPLYFKYMFEARKANISSESVHQKTCIVTLIGGSHLLLACFWS